MQIQCIEEIVDVEHIEDSLRAITTSMTNEDDTRVNTGADFDEIEPAKLGLPFSAEDSPEIFKRVRYISRWEYRSESRGSLFYRTDQYCLWKTGCIEAKSICRALAKSLCCTLPCDIIQGPHSWDNSISLRIFFVGTSVQRSRPMVMIFSMKKKYRKVAWKHSKEMDWIKACPYLTILTASNSIFQESVKNSWKRRRKI